MAATVVKRLPYSVHLASVDADFDWGDDVTPDDGTSIDKNPPLNSITFVPGANNDKLIVRDASITGPIIFHALCLNTDEKIQYYYGSRKRPVIDFSECTFSAGHYVIFDIAKRN
jgi:hypothetical protein